MSRLFHRRVTADLTTPTNTMSCLTQPDMHSLTRTTHITVTRTMESPTMVTPTMESHLTMPVHVCSLIVATPIRMVTCQMAMPTKMDTPTKMGTSTMYIPIQDIVDTVGMYTIQKASRMRIRVRLELTCVVSTVVTRTVVKRDTTWRTIPPLLPRTLVTNSTPRTRRLP